MGITGRPVLFGRYITENTWDTAQEVTPWKRTPKMPKETGNGGVKV